MSAFWATLWSIMAIKCHSSTSHHPQTDEQPKRDYLSIKQVLRSFMLTSGNERVWVKHLAFHKFALNSAILVPTGKPSLNWCMKRI